MADLSESVDDLRKVARDLDDRAAGGGALSASAWADAWDAAGWLIARADTSRDAVARALWPPPPERARARFDQFHEELADLMRAFLAARALVEERLTAVGEPRRAISMLPAASWLRSWRRVSMPAWLRSWRRVSMPAGWLPSWRRVSMPTDWLRGWRGAQMRTALLVAVGVVLLVVGGVAVLGGRAPETSILGGQGTPEQTGTGAAAGGPQSSGGTPAPGAASEPEAPSVRADLDFDTLRVGALEGATGGISDIAGLIDVVPYPSPFDRSVRMVGSGSHRFCVSIPGLESREVSAAVDLYSASLPFAAFEFAVVPSDGPGTAAGIPSDLVTSLVPERWYEVSARWQPGMPATIKISEAGGGEVLSQVLPLSTPAPGSTIGGLCLSASGMASDGELMLDNLRVDQ